MTNLNKQLVVLVVVATAVVFGGLLTVPSTSACVFTDYPCPDGYVGAEPSICGGPPDAVVCVLVP